MKNPTTMTAMAMPQRAVRSGRFDFNTITQTSARTIAPMIAPRNALPLDVPTNNPVDNGFKIQWEAFLKHVVCDTPFPWSLLEGAKGVQLAELGQKSWKERRWVDVPDLAG